MSDGVYEEPQKYYACFQGRKIEVDLENPSTPFQKIMQWHRAKSFDILCAQNLDDTIGSAAENENAHYEFINEANAKGWTFLEGVRRSTNGDWPDEKILVVFETQHP